MSVAVLSGTAASVLTTYQLEMEGKSEERFVPVKCSRSRCQHRVPGYL